MSLIRLNDQGKLPILHLKTGGVTVDQSLLYVVIEVPPDNMGSYEMEKFVRMNHLSAELRARISDELKMKEVPPIFDKGS